MEMTCLPIFKLIITIVITNKTFSAIRSDANFLYAILFSEGCGCIVGAVY